jgi:phosphatidylglycerol:prolipoprotein diacylglycerol transferase
MAEAQPGGLPLLEVGGLALRPSGLLAAAGLLAGLWLARRAARRDGLDPALLARLVTVAAGAGLVGAHLLDLLAYHPGALADPWALLRLGDGLSSMGGLLGGAAGAALVMRGRRPGLLEHGDALALGLAPGWALGRVGCALVHDHPGRLTTSPLGVRFPDGLRHDLGAYEAVLLALLWLVLLGLRRAGLARGRLLPTLAAGYGAGRFALDALRATDLPGADPRHLGLTPAQWGCLALAGWGLAALRAPRRV